jgi:hypothetical protein
MIKALLTPVILGLAVAMVIRVAMARRAEPLRAALAANAKWAIVAPG